MTVAAAVVAAAAVIVFLVRTDRKMARDELTQHGPFWDMFDPARPAQPPALEEPDGHR